MTLNDICTEIAKQQARGRLVERVELPRPLLEMLRFEAGSNGNYVVGTTNVHTRIMDVPVVEVIRGELPRLVVWMDRVEVAL
jgi:hypothetical protein